MANRQAQAVANQQVQVVQAQAVKPNAPGQRNVAPASLLNGPSCPPWN